MDLVFATHNWHKVSEVQPLMPSSIRLKSLSDIGCAGDIPEMGATLRENAIYKAEYVRKHFQVNCFSDDTGLEVDALGGAPGVRSARYAAEPPDSEANIDKLLREMAHTENRHARFRTVIALILGDALHVFEGVAEGEILKSRVGVGGFGYDSVFLPLRCSRTFAQLTREEKNVLSHRGKAVRKLIGFLNAHYKNV